MYQSRLTYSALEISAPVNLTTDVQVAAVYANVNVKKWSLSRSRNAPQQGLAVIQTLGEELGINLSEESLFA